jgi:hypothetical protein
MRGDRRSPGVPEDLSLSLHRQLGTYALAAGATSVSLLALAPPSPAEVVYTPANQIIGRQSSYSIDLNHDGIIDFVIVERPRGNGPFGTIQSLSVKPPTGNQVKCITISCFSTFIYPAALRPGSPIGSSQRGWLAGGPMAVEALFAGGSVRYSFVWVNVTDRYLGLRFKINGESHFGWARLSVKFHGGPPKNRTWEAYLTGYAYETIAGKAIIAGQTSANASEDEDQSNASFQTMPLETLQFAALGELALGANGLELWRRDEAESD